MVCLIGVLGTATTVSAQHVAQSITSSDESLRSRYLPTSVGKKSSKNKTARNKRSTNRDSPPRVEVSTTLGKKAAWLKPHCALATAMARSADATSGRRSNNAEGTPSGTCGTCGKLCDEATEDTTKEGAGSPTKVAMACSNYDRCRRRISTWVKVLSSSACCCATSKPEVAPSSLRAVTKAKAFFCRSIDRASTCSSASKDRKLI